MASKGAVPDNRTLPSKEAGLFRQLAKQYEVRMHGMRPQSRPLVGPVQLGLLNWTGADACQPAPLTVAAGVGSGGSRPVFPAGPFCCRPSNTRRASRMLTPFSRSFRSTARRWP